MERKRNSSVIWLLAWAGMAGAGMAYAQSVPIPYVDHAPVLLAIPSANVIPHAQYHLNGRFQYFTTATPGAADTAATDSILGTAKSAENLNYTSELLIGIENRAEIGVQYGRDFSLSIKALLIREDLLWPDIVFGVRNLFGTQEGTLYGIADAKTDKVLQSESYMTVAKTFSRSRVHLGASVLTHANKGPVSVNAGLEQGLGAGAYLGYEVFERFSDFHQLLSLEWKFRNLVALSVGMTEFQSWVRQDGEWGFFLTPSHTLPNGYNSPGITVALQVMGWVPHREKKTLPERVAILEIKNRELEMQAGEISALKARLDNLEAENIALQQGPLLSDTVAVKATTDVKPSSAENSGPVVPKGNAEVVNLLRAVTEQVNSDLSDPKETREMMAHVVALGPAAVEAVRRQAQDTSAGPGRIAALMVINFSKDTVYIPTLRALCADGDPRIRRESLTALVKLAGRGGLEETKKLLSDPDEAVAIAAGEAYRQITGEAVRNGEAGKNGKSPSQSRRRARPSQVK